MNITPLQPFTRNYQDNSTDAGFQFTFQCDICNDGYKTNFIASKTYKKAGMWKGIGKAISIGSSLAGRSAGYTIERGTDAMSQRFQGMTPDWHKEHEQAFELAQNEAKGHFHRCPRCHKYVCENDWNEQEGLCTEDAPRESTEVAAARAEKMVTDIKQKAENTQVFTGEIPNAKRFALNAANQRVQANSAIIAGHLWEWLFARSVAQKTLQESVSAANAAPNLPKQKSTGSKSLSSFF